MDPNATLTDIHEAILNGDLDAASVACDYMLTWLLNNGAAPDNVNETDLIAFCQIYIDLSIGSLGART